MDRHRKESELHRPRFPKASLSSAQNVRPLLREDKSKVAIAAP
jgi:hypothetical protein